MIDSSPRNLLFRGNAGHIARVLLLNIKFSYSGENNLVRGGIGGWSWPSDFYCK